MHEFSRKTFLKGGGALVVGFSLAGLGARAATAADSPYASNGPFDQFQVDSWVTINADNTASISTRSIRGSRSMPTTPRRSSRAASSRGPALIRAC